MKRGVMLIILTLLLVGCEEYVDPYEQFKDVVKPGMQRSEVISSLQESSWYHQECPRGTPTSENYFMADLFFFGSHKYDKAEILIVDSAIKEGVLIVTGVGTFESYAWHTGYADCIQRERFED